MRNLQSGITFLGGSALPQLIPPFLKLLSNGLCRQRSRYEA